MGRKESKQTNKQTNKQNVCFILQWKLLYIKQGKEYEKKTSSIATAEHWLVSRSYHNEITGNQ